MSEVTFLTKVEIEGTDTVVVFPPGVIEILDLHANEVLQWTIAGDGSINIKKLNYIHASTEK